MASLPTASARVICKRAEPLRLPAGALSSAGQRAITPAIDTVVVAAGNKLAVTKDIVPTETPRSSVTFFATPHASEIESLELRGAILACADASGRASLLRVSNWANGATDALEVASQLSPPFAASHGWTGIRFAGDKVVTASFGGRYIAAYDDGKLVSTAPTALRPAALCVTEEGTLLVAEGNSMSAWDLRAAFAPVKRIRASHESLYALATVNQLVAVAGADRSVHVFDTRKWAARGHWSSCLKYSVTSVHFAQDSQACYVGGLDSEWTGKSSQSHFDGFRADSRWLGIAKGVHDGQDYIAGCTERGSVYVIASSFGLYTAPKGKDNTAREDAEMD